MHCKSNGYFGQAARRQRQTEGILATRNADMLMRQIPITLTISKNQKRNSFEENGWAHRAIRLG
jgi:hypothetical protein